MRKFILNTQYLTTTAGSTASQETEHKDPDSWLLEGKGPSQGGRGLSNRWFLHWASAPGTGSCDMLRQDCLLGELCVCLAQVAGSFWVTSVSAWLRWLVPPWKGRNHSVLARLYPRIHSYLWAARVRAFALALFPHHTHLMGCCATHSFGNQPLLVVTAPLVLLCSAKVNSTTTWWILLARHRWTGLWGRRGWEC